MDKSFPLVMVAVMVAFATIGLIKRFVQPPTAELTKRDLFLIPHLEKGELLG